jgi:hypothetical protein
VQRLAIPAVDGAVVGAGDPHCVGKEGGEYLLQVAGRIADRAQDVGRRFLLLRYFIELAGQPRDGRFPFCRRWLLPRRFASA